MFEMGKVKSSIREFQNILKLDPNHVEARRNIKIAKQKLKTKKKNTKKKNNQRKKGKDHTFNWWSNNFFYGFNIKTNWTKTIGEFLAIWHVEKSKIFV